MNLTSRDNKTANEPKVLGSVNISKLVAVQNKSMLTTFFFFYQVTVCFVKPESHKISKNLGATSKFYAPEW
jgi:hypothetical protein